MSDSVTRILAELQSSDGSAADRLLPLLYNELRALAAHCLQHERPDHTLQPTALVHEAYMKLVGDGSTSWENRAHFIGVAARAMRQVLVDHARKLKAAKRGGGQKAVTLDDTLDIGPRSTLDLMALDEALEHLAALDNRQSRIVELRFFGGLTASETACTLGISLSTVENDWRMARAWLHRELAPNSGGPT